MLVSVKHHYRFFLITGAVIVFLGMLFLGAAHWIDTADFLQRKPALSSPSDYGLDYVSVSFPSDDGLTIKGWLLPTTLDAPVVILMHGMGANRATPEDRVYGIAGDCIEHGYNVMMFDLRGQGESEGSRISAGLEETGDVTGAISYLRDEGYTGPVGMLGFSMGAATALMSAAEHEDIRAVVADSSYTDVASVIGYQLSQARLPGFLVEPALFLTKILYGVDFSACSPLKAAASLEIPVLFIHGGNDDTVPVDDAYELLAASVNALSDIWVVPEASHTNAWQARTGEYTERLFAFFEASFNSNSLPDPFPPGTAVSGGTAVTATAG